MLPNILPCIEQPPTTRPYPAPNVSSAEAEKPALGQAVSSHSRKLSCEGVETGTLASLFHRGGQRLKGRKQLVEEGVASSFSQHIFIKYLLYASYYSNCRTETRAHFFIHSVIDIFCVGCRGYVVMNQTQRLTPWSSQCGEGDSHSDTDEAVRPEKPRATWRNPGRLPQRGVYKLRCKGGRS